MPCAEVHAGTADDKTGFIHQQHSVFTLKAVKFSCHSLVLCMSGRDDIQRKNKLTLLTFPLGCDCSKCRVIRFFNQLVRPWPSKQALFPFKAVTLWGDTLIPAMLPLPYVFVNPLWILLPWPVTRSLKTSKVENLCPVRIDLISGNIPKPSGTMSGGFSRWSANSWRVKMKWDSKVFRLMAQSGSTQLQHH